MPDDLSDKEIHTLDLIEAFPAAHLDDGEVEGLIRRGLFERMAGGLLVVTPTGNAVLRQGVKRRRSESR